MFEMSVTEKLFFDYLKKHKGWHDLIIDFEAIKIRDDVVRIIPTFNYLFHMMQNQDSLDDFEWKNKLINTLWKNVSSYHSWDVKFGG